MPLALQARLLSGLTVDGPIAVDVLLASTTSFLRGLRLPLGVTLNTFDRRTIKWLLRVSSKLQRIIGGQ